MAKIFTPIIYNADSPIGLDVEIAAIQAKIARLTFMQYIFGVANHQFDVIDDKRRYYPQGRKFDQDIDLSFDDSYASRCFFVAKDPINVNTRTDDWDWTEGNVEIAHPFAFIFHCNLQSLEIDSSEAIKTAILNSLDMCPKVKMTQAFEDIGGVWNGFTITDDMKGMTRYPNYCLRVDGVVTYMNYPFNGNSQFNPSVYDNAANESILPNINPGLPNIN